MNAYQRSQLSYLLPMAGILIVFVGVQVQRYVGRRNDHPMFNARMMIKMLEMALTMYRNDFGAYPDDTRPVAVFNALTGYGADPDVPDPAIVARPDWHGPYIRCDAKQFRNAARNQELIDSWGQPYRLRLQQPRHNKDGVDLWSCGRNGRDEDGAGDDIKNW
jgi:hypothetical protein